MDCRRQERAHYRGGYGGCEPGGAYHRVSERAGNGGGADPDAGWGGAGASCSASGSLSEGGDDVVNLGFECVKRRSMEFLIE